MKSNLLSVHRFCRDNAFSFHFDAHRFQITDLLTAKPLYTGFSKDGLYPIHGLSLPSWNSRLSSCPSRSALSSPSPANFKTECLSSVCSNASQADLWRMRLGHPQPRVFKHLSSQSLLGPRSISSNSSFCKHCVMGKMTQLPFSTSHSCTKFPLELVHSDVWGPAPISSINGFRYYVIFVDDFTRFTWFFPLRHKSQVLSSFQHFKNTMENLLGKSIKILRTDCGSEYTHNEFRNFCSNNGIFHQFTCPHTSQQNGIAERKHRHIVDIALTLISQSSLPFQYWSYAFSTAVFLINRLPSINRNSLSPWENIFGTSPNYSLFKSFGCACFPLLRPYSKHKFSLRSKECIFLGYASNSKGYLCLDPITSRFYISRHVKFNEHHFPFSSISSSSKNISHSSTSKPWLSTLLFFHACSNLSPLPFILGPVPAQPTGCPLNTQPTDCSSHTPTSHIPPMGLSQLPSILGPLPSLMPSPNTPHSPPSLLGPIPSQIPNPFPSSSSAPAAPLSVSAAPPALPLPDPPSLAPILPTTSSHPMQTRSKSGIFKKKSFNTITTNYLQTEPPNYTIASKIPEWQQAMASEFEALTRQKTWSLVSSSSPQNVVGCRWVYKIKRNPNGSVSRYKARLVAKGFHQQAGVNYDETFSPVVKPPTVRIILSLAAHHHWTLRQLDVSNAFLHGVLKETVFMSQPLGFVDEDHPSHVCQLHKSLYGLKQAPRAWFERFTSHLLTLGFTASVADTSLFVLRHGSVTVYLLLYVDDIIITGNDSSTITSIISQLSAVFELKDLGPLRYFLGLQIDYTKSGFFVHQRKYLTDLLTKFHMLDSKVVPTSIVLSPALTPSKDDVLSDPTAYRSLVGAL